jgi:uncharacterized protein (DUF2236 family)
MIWDTQAIEDRHRSAFFNVLEAPDVEQLLDDRRVFGECVEIVRSGVGRPVEGVFGPGSYVWRLFGDPLTSAGAIRAVALQIAHPSVAAAGIEYSRFREDFIGRAWRTYAVMSELVFGDLDAAIAAAERLHVMHAMVRGAIPQSASERRAGQAYRATDPASLLWVLATLYEASVWVQDLLIEPMSQEARERYYAEMLVLGTLLGIPQTVLPDGLEAFDGYWQTMIENELEVGPAGRELMLFLLGSSLSRVSRVTRRTPLTTLDDAWIRSSLPDHLAAAYGIRPSARDRRLFAGARSSLAGIAQLVPQPVRRTPAHHQAILRVRRADGRGEPLLGRAVEHLNRRVRLPMSLEPIGPLTGDAVNVMVDLKEPAARP